MHIDFIIAFCMLLLVIASAFFSATETAYTSVTKLKLEQIGKQKPHFHKILTHHFESFGLVLATILVLNNLVNIAASSLGTYFFAIYFNPGDAALISTAAITPIIVLFGEIFPKMIARNHPLGYLSKIVFFMQILIWIFYPLTFWLKRFLQTSKITVTEDEIHHLLNIAHKEKILELNEAGLAKRALNFDSLQVKKVMIHRKNVWSVNYEDSIEQVRIQFKNSGFSRLPVVKKENFIGYVYIKMLVNPNFQKWQEIIRPFESVDINDDFSYTLSKMKKTKNQLLFLLDKNKGKKYVAGIITMEDILETLVGKIYNEIEATSEIQEISLNEFKVEAKTNFKEITDFFYDIEFKNLKKNRKITVKTWVMRTFKLKQLTHQQTLQYKNLTIKITFGNDGKCFFKFSKI